MQIYVVASTYVITADVIIVNISKRLSDIVVWYVWKCFLKYILYAETFI